MRTCRKQLVRSLGAAAVIAGIAAPVTLAGHEEYGVRCALALSQHRADAGKICAQAGDRGLHAATPTITVVQPSGFDWGDAGVGAAGALGLLALAGGAVIVTRHGAHASA
jgi:hypothetical protein